MRIHFCLVAPYLLGLAAFSGAQVRADVLYVSERNNTITQVDTSTQAASTFVSAGLKAKRRTELASS